MFKYLKACLSLKSHRKSILLIDINLLLFLFTSSSDETLRFDQKKNPFGPHGTSRTFLLQWNIIPHCPTTLFFSLLMIFNFLTRTESKTVRHCYSWYGNSKKRIHTNIGTKKIEDLNIQGFYSINSVNSVIFKHYIKKWDVIVPWNLQQS